MHTSPTIYDDEDPWIRVLRGLGALGGVLVAGTIAYRLLGLVWLDAFYQTVITVTTVGYGEIPPESGEIGTTYRLVTSILVLGGVAVGVYTLGVFFEALIEGRLAAHLGRVRMQRELDQLSGHIIVCGYGQVGQAIVADLAHHGDAVVVVDQDENIHTQIDVPTIRGDATDDSILVMAGIAKARGLVTALDSDAGNLFVTVSARTANPELYIVSRANNKGSVGKLTAAGANRVVNPHQIGGARMASFMVRPNVADFIGESMTDARFEIRLTETVIGPTAPLAGQSIVASGVRDRCGVTVVAIRRPDGSFLHQPAGDSMVSAGDVIIALGTEEQQAKLQAWIGNS